MKKWSLLASLVLSYYLVGCASSPTAPAHNEMSQSSERLESPALQKARRQINAFASADAAKVVLPYAMLTNQIQTLTEEEICQPEQVDSYRQMLALNPTSLMGISLIVACEELSDEQLLPYLEAFESTIRVMLLEGNGVSLESAVKIRELGEAELILSSADYLVLDQEVVEYGDRFAFRFHAVDQDSGEFEYHYYDNFAFLKKIFQAFSLLITDKMVTEATLAEFLKRKEPGAINALTTKLLEQGSYQEIIDLLKPLPELSPVSRVRLARAYLYQMQHDALFELVDSLIEQKDIGDVNAAVFIAEMMLTLDAQSNQENVNAILTDVDNRTRLGNGAFLLASVFLQSESFDAFQHWALKSLEQNSKAHYAPLVELLKADKYQTIRLKLLEAAHQAKMTSASYDLAVAYRDGIFGQAEPAKARQLFYAAAQSGHRDAMYQLGFLLASEEGGPIDAPGALEWFKKAAALGEQRALNEIAVLHYRGTGDLAVDYTQAREWLVKAAETGSAIAHRNLGIVYQYGKAVPVDIQTALAYYEKGAELGDVNASKRLGDYYSSDEQKNFRSAEKWYRKCADLNDSNCQFRLAELYAIYLDNESEAINWFDRVVQSDNAELITWTANHFGDGAAFLRIDKEKAFELLHRASLMNNAQAQVNLGFMYETGYGVEKNLVRARELYQQSAAQNYPQGMNNLATFYKEGLGGLEVDTNKALELYLKAAQAGNDFANNNLGKMYFFGEFVEEDELKALSYFIEAAEQGFEGSYYYLGFLYVFSDVVEKDYQKSFEYFKKSYATGNSNAAAGLASLYGTGRGVKKDIDKAIYYLRQESIMNDDGADPDFAAAVAFHFGEYGLDVNYDVALKYYKKATKNGHGGAINNLAELYRLGQGVNQDYRKAISLYKRAIEIGEPIAMFNMAELYRDGHGVNIDAKKSFDWMKKSADAGFLDAYVELSKFYMQGFGTATNQAAAIEWLEKAVEENYYLAQFELALLLYKGEGVSKDISQAKKLMQLSADQGFQKAIDIIENNYEGV